MFKQSNNNIKISVKEKLNFLESFSSLLNSGIPITNALKIIEYQSKSAKTKILINSISKNINSGLSLEECFMEFPKIFNNFDISLIKM
jgi:type IV pilus assembly protein PilC